ncbi:hypothetical protein BH09PAT4_BH09PAT4_02890 [soil metagenome]
MKRKSPSSLITSFVAYSVAVVLVLVPVHAFLTVWLSSLLGHYTMLRLWKEGLLLIAGLGVLYILLLSPKLRQQIKREWLWRIIGAYAVVTIICGIFSYVLGSVTAKAALYGELLDLRPFAMLVIAWIAASSAPWLYQRWRQLVLAPAAIVVAVGLLQRFVLPYDVMKHFGYSDSTIWPYETIDHKTTYIRIRSTLRGANLLGAYLIVVLSALGDLFWGKRRQLLISSAIVASLVTLYASGSRGAWLGALAAAVVLTWLRLPTPQARKAVFLAGGACLVVLVATVVALRNNDFVQNTVFHTDEHSTSTVSSNSAHVSYTVDAVKQIVTEPLGRGPGTAGPASVYNDGHETRIAENNFLQIGQEAGWLGLGLFVAIYVLVAKQLWVRRRLALAQVLLASLAGLTVMALLMHIWTDDTVAYLWFGLAGLILAQPAKERRAKAR